MTDDVPPAESGHAQLLSERSALAETFTRLQAAGDPHRRGRDFETLLERAFQLAHFQVQLNPGMAQPRQTDLSARYGDHRYLVEAKWQTAKADLDVLGGVRDRLRRTNPGVIGLIVSVAGFTSTVIAEIGQERNLPIVLFNEDDLLGVLNDPETLPALLRTKLEELVTHGRVHLGGPTLRPGAPHRRDRPLPRPNLTLQDLDGTAHTYLTVPGGFTSVAFGTEVTDVDWSYGRGTGACLDMPVAARDQEALTEPPVWAGRAGTGQPTAHLGSPAKGHLLVRHRPRRARPGPGGRPGPHGIAGIPSPQRAAGLPRHLPRRPVHPHRRPHRPRTRTRRRRRPR